MNKAAVSTHRPRRFGTDWNIRHRLSFLANMLMFCIGVSMAAVPVAHGADLTVTVSDQYANPITGATVYFYTADLDYTGSYGYTDASGAVSFGDVDQYQPDDYQFKVRYLNLEFWSDVVSIPTITAVAVTIQTEPVGVTAYYAGQVAASVKVYLYSDTGSCLSVYQTTGDDGRAVFYLPVGNSFKFRADILGSQYMSESLQVIAGGPNEVTIDGGGGRFHISYTTDTAEPLAGYQVRLYNPAGCYLGLIGTTDADGGITFAVSQGTYRVRFDYYGHQFWSDDVYVQADETLSMTLPHHAVTVSVAGLFQGSQIPVQAARVQLYTDTGSWVDLSQYSDAAGQVFFSLPEKPYKVIVTYLGQQYESEVFTATDTMVSIPMGQAELFVNWNGAPLPDLDARLYTQTGGSTSLVQTTDAAGKSLFTLPTGIWMFRIDYQGSQYWSAESTVAADTVTAVELSTGGGTLSLTITKDDGQPLEGLNCTVYTATGGCTGVKGATNSAGLVSFDLAEGAYQVIVSYLGHAFTTQIYDIQEARDEVMPIPHQDVTVTVNGLYDTLEPIQRAKVGIYTGDGHWTPLYQTTDEAGQAVFSLPEREFKARVTYQGNEIWSADPFIWQPAEVTMPMAEYRLTITGAGHALENAYVKVYNESESCVGPYGYTDADGQILFRLPALIPYKFKATYLYHSFWSDLVAPIPGQLQDVAIATGGGNFTFTVLKDAQTPIINAKCYLYDAQGSYSLGLWSYTDENGQVKFDLVDGSFSVKVCYLGYNYFSTAFTVPDTFSQSLTIAHSDLQFTVNGLLDQPSPIEGAKVEIYTGANGWLGLYQYSDAQGQTLFSLPAQDYRAKVSYQGVTLWSDVFNNTDAAIEIPMAQATITVTGAAESFENVKIYAYTGTGGWLGVYQYTNADGQALFTLPAGDFKFIATYQGKKFDSGVVTLVHGTPAQVTIETGGGIFTLHLQQDAYQGLPNVWCYVYTDAGSCIGVYGKTDDQGSVSFALSDGAYKFKISYLGNEYWSDIVTVPQDLALTITLAHQRYEIIAQGINPGPRPLAGIKFYIYTTAEKSAGLSGYTDADGKISFDLADGQYKAKYYYNGEYYWTDTLQPYGTLVSINTGDTSVPGPVQNLTAVINSDNLIELTWAAPADTGGFTLAGYALYRRHICAADFELITPDLIAATVTTFVDSSVSPAGTYIYYMAAVTDTGVAGHLSPIVAAGFSGTLDGENTDVVSDLTAAWDQEIATLSWSPVAGSAYQIYRGTAPDALSPYQRTATAAYLDQNANPGRYWYYQVASVKTLCDPQSGQPVDLIGPLSALVTLAPLLSPGVVTPDLQITAAGDYLITAGTSQGYTLEGDYSGFEGDVIVTATLNGETITGVAGDGHFSIQLPGAGNWQITISEADGWPSTTIDTDWQIDDQAPSLTVEGSDSRSTGESLITITGTAVDSQSPLQGVSITSDRYTGRTFGTTIDALGNFSGQVPLKVGDNQLVITAADIHGNSAGRTITVTQTVTALPVIEITSPADGVTVLDPRIDVTGTVRSTLSPDKIRLTLGDLVTFPTGADNDYTFAFTGINLAEGANIITVTAETAYGTVGDQATVQYTGTPQDTQALLPRIEVFAPLPESWLTGDTIVTGLVRSDLGVGSVTVNGQTATAVGLGATLASFQAPLSFGTGDTSIAITIVAEDLAGHTSLLEYFVYLDNGAPVITLNNSVEQSPAINATTQTPYIISGTITDPQLAGATINNQSITLSPGSESGTYTFHAGLPLTYGADQYVALSARDLAGNSAGLEWIVRLDSDLTIEVIAPGDGAQLQGQGDTLAVSVTVRVSGTLSDETFNVALDGGAAQAMTRNGSVGNITLSVPTSQADHTLAFSVQNTGGIELATTTTAFSVQNTDLVPLALERQEPLNNATGVEPNQFIAFYFNKPIDPALLTIQVLETAHGQTYATPAGGGDMADLNKIELETVDLDREPVTGGISYFPENTMVAFYPRKDFAYGANIQVHLLYDSATLAKSVFDIRPLPTFIQGFVIDQFNNPLEGIDITIAALGKTARSDREGGFGFGFAEGAGDTLPAGRYRAVANPSGKNSAFGSTEFFVDIAAGRLNSTGMIRIPFLNSQEPYRMAAGNLTTPVPLAGGDLVLDLTDTGLVFPDGAVHGAVHAQLMKIQEIAYAPLSAAYPAWVFALQPGGVAVEGTLGITFNIPKLFDSHDYVAGMGKRVILVALDSVTLKIVPVGVGLVDDVQMKVTSEKPVGVQRLDILGYALTGPENQTILEAFANDEISLQQMIAQLQARY